MNTVTWIILLVLVTPLVGVLAWVLLEESIVNVPSGSLGLLMVKGKATETTLLPGRHFVPALRRRMVAEYPSVELAHRSGSADPPGGQSDLERVGPPLRVTLGDGATAVVSYTVRFRLIPEQLHLVHERFGPAGIFGVVRDESSKAVTKVLGGPEITVDGLHGAARDTCQEQLGKAVELILDPVGIRATGFVLGAVDLGRTGEVIQATIRARYELEQEKADAATRMTRALNDLDLQGHLDSVSDTVWRYREVDAWRDIVHRTEALSVALRAGPGGSAVVSTGRAKASAPDQQTMDQQTTDRQ